MLSLTRRRWALPDSDKKVKRGETDEDDNVVYA